MKIAKLTLTFLILMAVQAWAEEWVQCALENDYCRVDGTATVRFGAGNRWASQTVQGGVQCTPDVFGDPADGVRKACYVLVQDRRPRREERRDERRDDQFNSRSWVKCSDEDGYCRVKGTAIVKYGAGRQWATRNVNGGITCSTAAFGGDPAPGVVKSCYIVYPDRVSDVVDPPNWVQCANEDGVCRFNGRRRVSFGAGKRWAYSVGNGSFSCSVAAFGSDPAPGVVKSCYYDSN